MPYTADNYSVDEQNKNASIKEGEKIVKIAGDRLKYDIPRLADDADYQKMHFLFCYGPDGNELQKAQKCFDNEDYNQVDSLSYGALSYQCNKYFRQLRAVFNDDGISMQDEEFRRYAEENLNNPFFRLAMEMAGNTPNLSPASLRNACREVGEKLNQLMMQKTVQPPTAEQKANLTKELGANGAKEALEQNRKEQLSIAKMMFMAHLGSFHTVGDSGLNKPYTGSVTEAFAHGGRTFFCFAPGKDGEKIIENTVFHDVHPNEGGNDKDYGSALVSRFVGTHGVEALDDDAGAGAFREVKSGGDTSGLHAMNPAVGGIGNKYGNVVMQNDGRSGHVFVKLQEGTAQKGGYLLVGFEGEKSLSTGKTGHMHTPWASKSKISSFGTGKGAPGAELGGRVVDLSCYKPELLRPLMKKFNEVYTKLQADCENNLPGSVEKMQKINKKLTENVMDNEKFIDFMKNDLGIQSVAVSTNHRNGKVSPEDILSIRDTVGKENFNRMNTKAERKAIRDNALQNTAERSSRVKYSLDNGLTALSEGLNKTKSTRLGIERADSSLMKNVKSSVSSVLALKEKGNYSPEEMKLCLAQLKVDTAKYLKERSAKNDRRKFVTDINVFAKKEMEAIDDFRKKHPEAPEQTNSKASLL